MVYANVYFMYTTLFDTFDMSLFIHELTSRFYHQKLFVLATKHGCRYLADRKCKTMTTVNCYYLQCVNINK